MSDNGSLWHRWDPHLHAPGTLLNDQFKGDWETYLQLIEKSDPRVRALGVTDYFSIETYLEALEKKANGRLPDVEFIFPNVEMRLDISTEKQASINLHLLFSPEDVNHVSEIDRILGLLTFSFRDRTYQCTRKGLEDLGRAVDPKQTDARGARRVGAQQFKTTLREVRALFKAEIWLAENCLVAVSGNENDGTAGLQNDASYRATRIEIERFANIVFSGSISQRDFWLGKKANFPVSEIERIYDCIKPCLHGSDAHSAAKVVKPDLEKYCWIKGDLSFESLKQVILEPDERVWIGVTPPDSVPPSYVIRSVETLHTSWLTRPAIPINGGLVAIIGARGSGKTALVDIIAAGGNATEHGSDNSSFINRASKYLKDATVALTWGDDTRSETQPLIGDSFDDNIAHQAVCYLSQHFVERLCSAEGLATSLRAEMERVVFQAIDATERLEADSFSELAERVLESPRHRRAELLASIASTTDEIVKEDLLQLRHPKLIAQRDANQKLVAKDRIELAKLLPKGQEARVKRLQALEEACANVETKIESLRRRGRLLDDLAEEIDNTKKDVDTKRLVDIKRRYNVLALKESDWAAFAMHYVGDVDGIIAQQKDANEKEIALALEGDPKLTVNKTTTPLASWPLNLLRVERDEIRKAVGTDLQKQKAYGDLQRAIVQKEAAIKRTETEITYAQGSVGRKSELVQQRRNDYKKIIETIVREETALLGLYAPLSTQLSDVHGSLSKLKFTVKRTVDLDQWVTNGEGLMDLRKASSFQGRGSLRQKSQDELLQAWLTGSAQKVAEAMDGFRERYARDFLNAQPALPDDEEQHKRWAQSVALWLYDTSHINVQYGIEYDGVSVELLSPGTRGIVLLLLYLAIDKQDRRPLLVDQPEENLDPKSVFEELVPYFREARKRRQIIIVTHNANLVVNTDADQVIVANAQPSASGGLPTVSYQLGGIESPAIRAAICDILEGGRRAFLERAKRYRIRLQ